MASFNVHGFANLAEHGIYYYKRSFCFYIYVCGKSCFGIYFFFPFSHILLSSQELLSPLLVQVSIDLFELLATKVFSTKVPF